MQPSLGFVGLGGIGRARLEALAGAGVAEVAALADPDAENLAAAAAIAPQARRCADYRELLAADLDGVVIATPNALHAEQAIAALARGMAVFCQKPLAVSARECAAVVAAAEANDRLLGVDLSYRHLRGAAAIKRLLDDGALGRVYAASLVFHNAYGPDKDWFYRRASSGGGCIADLGVHLIDLALWLFDFPPVEGVTCRCFTGGRQPELDEVEDYASLRLDFAGGAAVDLVCSWHLPLGRDCDIGLALYGSQGGAAVRNVGGSFFDFHSERYRGREAQTLVSAQQEGHWGPRALFEWVAALAAGAGFAAGARDNLRVAEVIERAYADAAGCRKPVLTRSRGRSPQGSLGSGKNG